MLSPFQRFSVQFVQISRRIIFFGRCPHEICFLHSRTWESIVPAPLGCRGGYCSKKHGDDIHLAHLHGCSWVTMNTVYQSGICLLCWAVDLSSGFKMFSDHVVYRYATSLRFVFIYVFICTRACGYPIEARRRCWILWSQSYGSCEPPNICAENWTQVLGKGSVFLTIKASFQAQDVLLTRLQFHLAQGRIFTVVRSFQFLKH